MRVPALLVSSLAALFAAGCGGGAHVLVIRHLAATPTGYFVCTSSDHYPASGGDCPGPNAVQQGGAPQTTATQRFVTIDTQRCPQVSTIVVSDLSSDHPQVQVSCEPGEAP